MDESRANWVAEVADRSELVSLLQAALARGSAVVTLPDAHASAGVHVLQIRLHGQPVVVLAASLERRLTPASFELRLWPLDPSHEVELRAIAQQEEGAGPQIAGPMSLSISPIFDTEPPLPSRASAPYDPERALIGPSPVSATDAAADDLTISVRSSGMPPPMTPPEPHQVHAVRDRHPTIPDDGSSIATREFVTSHDVTTIRNTSKRVTGDDAHPADAESYSVVFEAEPSTQVVPPSEGKPPRPPGSLVTHRDTQEWTRTLPLDPESQRAAQSARAREAQSARGSELVDEESATYPQALSRVAPSRAAISSGRGPRTQRRTGPVGVIGAGRIIANRYRIESLVGAGAIGAVYKATHVDLPRTFAIKVLHPHYRADAQLLASFRTEAQAASLLDHPNVTVVHDFGEEPDGIVYIVMEFLAGENLQRILDESLQLAPVRAINIMLQVCGALSAAHERGIVHRDVKPDNIMLIPSRDDEGRPFELVKVCDFGIAALESAADEADPEWTAGTPEYMAPEQAHGRADARTDVYACGIVLYEMLTGRPPFVGESPLAVVAQQMNERPRPLSEVLPGFPPAFEAVIARALEKLPERRQATMRELRLQLKRLL